MKRLFLVLLIFFMGSAMATANQSDVVLNETFDNVQGKLPRGWAAEDSAWRVDQGQLQADSLRGDTKILLGRSDWQNYEITVTATFDKVANNSRWLAIVFRAADDGKTPWSQFATRFHNGKRGGAEFAVRATLKRWSVRRSAKLPSDWQIGKPRQLRVVVRGSDMEAFVDGQSILKSAYCVDRDAGLVGLAVSGCIARFDDFSVRQLPVTPRLGDMPLKPCTVVAHRGYSAVAPENTVSAIKQAIRAGADASECDVRRSKDGHIIAMHDLAVNRTTNGKGKVADLTFHKLRKLDAGSWKNRRFKGEKVPTLDEILTAHKDSGCMAVVEIKVKGIDGPVVEAVRKGGMMDQTTVIAFDGEVVRAVREREPRLPCSWLCGKYLKGTPSEQVDWIEKKAKQYKTNMVDLSWGMLSGEIIDELHRRGLVVWAWTVDDPVLIDALMRWGVDGITTNRPNIIVKRNKEAKGR